MSTPLTLPRDGLPDLLATPHELSRAAERISAGRGPVAIDTERASGFRYDDRAFLLQVRRRGTGTLLIDPAPHRELIGDLLTPALNERDWVLHAAPSDLPSLAWLGLYPGRVFDTELAGRLAGLDQVNLAAMIEQFLGYSLAKGYGAEDWSQRPLPQSWLNYAALDVELLLELAEAVTELLDTQGKLEWAEQEFDHIRDRHAAVTAPEEPQWRSTKGVGTLNKPEQLVVARELWRERDTIARSEDSAVGRILPNRVLVEIARSLPRTMSDLAAIRGFPARRPGATRAWFSVVRRARTSPRETWPERLRPPRGVPNRRTWSTEYPESYAHLTRIRTEIEKLSTRVGTPAENLLRPAVLREVVWDATRQSRPRSADQVVQSLSDHDARTWQIELVAPLVCGELFGRAGQEPGHP